MTLWRRDPLGWIDWLSFRGVSHIGAKTVAVIVRYEQAKPAEDLVAEFPNSHAVGSVGMAGGHGMRAQRSGELASQHGDKLGALLLTLASSATLARRGVVRVIVSAALSGTLVSVHGHQAQAAKNRNRKQNDHKNKNKNKNKNKENDKKGKSRPEVDGPRLPPSPSPAPPTGPGFCPSDPTNLIGIAQIRRVAQTFLPPRSGRLTDAWVTLTENQSGLDLIVEIRTVGPQGVPSNSVLASVQVIDIPQTDRGSFRRTVAATFAPPAAITVGQRYALSVTGPDGQPFSLEGVDDDTCPDGRLFRDDQANGVFYGNSNALVFAVSITD